MALSNELISQFVKVTQDKEQSKKESTAYGKIIKQGDIEYVQLDGSELLTPISSTIAVKDNDRVMVTIKNHSAIVTGNLTDRSASGTNVKEMGNTISEFEIVVADKVTTQDLEAVNAYIENIKAISGKYEELSAITAEIETLQAKYASMDHITAKDAEIINAEIESLKGKFAEFTQISTEDLEAVNAEFDNLVAYNATFTYVSAEVLDAMKANIDDLEVNKLDAKSADILYANIDFANIKEAAIEKLFADSGIIKDLIMSGGKVTGELVGVTIKGDLIEGNTLKADKLVILGEDGLYYKLNVDALGETTASADEKYQNGLDGSVIIAESITAEKIAVDDLVAFGATIGGYHINDHALYSGVKNSVSNTTRGVYLGDDGQIAVGDSKNFLKMFIDENGEYKLEIQANSIKFGANGSSINDIVKDVTKDVVDESIAEQMNNISIGGTNLLRGTNTVTKLTGTGTWNNGTWRAASSGTGTRTNVEVTDAPNSNIKTGWHIVSTEGQVMIAQDFVPTSNEQEYTISCYAKGTGKVELQYGNADVGYQYKQITINNTEWTKCSYTFTSKGGGNAYFGANGDDGVNFTESDVYICGMKLETGNISTDWSPSIDNVIVGGRNLLVETATSESIDVDSPDTYVWYDAYSTYNKQTLADLGLKVGDEVAISFNWSISQNGDLDIVYGSFRTEWYGIKDDTNQYLAPIENPTAIFNSDNMSGEAKITIALTEDALGAHTIRFRIDNSVLTLSISKIKLEIGNSPTDWTPAPEDVDSDISKAQNTADTAQTTADNAQNTANTAQATVTALQNMISHLVTDANGGSLMTQTPDGWTFNISSITGNLEAIQNAMENMDDEHKDTNDALEKLTDLVNSVVNKTAYITISTDDDGAPCIELGKTDNLFKVRITNTAIDFLEGSTKIAYANNHTFYSNKIITNEIQIGEGPGFAWITRSNGNMGLVYISN